MDKAPLDEASAFSQDPFGGEEKGEEEEEGPVRDLGAGGFGVGEEAEVAGEGFGALDGGEAGEQEVGVGGIQGEAAAGAGDGFEEGGVGVHVAAFGVHGGFDLDEKRALGDGGVGGEEALDFGALEGDFDVADGEAAQGGGVVAGGFHGDEAAFDGA